MPDDVPRDLATSASPADTGPIRVDDPEFSADPARRIVLAGLGALPLAAVLADPRLAGAQAATLEQISLITNGGKNVSAFIAMPETVPAPAIVLIHEWWGLNDQIKSVAAEYARNGFVALAVDLYDGAVATSRDDARAAMQAVDGDQATDTLVSWIEFLRDRDDTTDKVGTVGWCFGGGWSLKASLATPVDATVIYYGRVGGTPDELKRLKGPVLGHFATRDGWINADMVGAFEKALAEAGETDVEINWYVADHAFANPSGGRYDADDAALSWARTLTFFKKNLG